MTSRLYLLNLREKDGEHFSLMILYVTNKWLLCLKFWVTVSILSLDNIPAKLTVFEYERLVRKKNKNYLSQTFRKKLKT